MSYEYGIETELLDRITRENEGRDTEWRQQIARVRAAYPKLDGFLTHVERLTTLTWMVAALGDPESWDFGDDHDQLEEETHGHLMWFFSREGEARGDL